MIKKALKHKFISFAAIIAAVLLLYAVKVLTFGDVYRLTVVSQSGAPFETSTEISDITGDVSAEVKSKTDKKDYSTAVFKVKGSGSVLLALRLKTDTRTLVSQKEITVKNGIVTDNFDDDIYIVDALVTLLAAVFALLCFFDSLKKDRYAYSCIVWLSVSLILFLQLLMWLASLCYSLSVYRMFTGEIFRTIGDNLMTGVTVITLPFAVFFALAVVISNIRLMQKEGKRPQNALGIAGSVLMFSGVFAVAALLFLSQRMQYLWIDIAYSVSAALCVFFEIVLLSTTICGVYAGVSVPVVTADYIIILGCKIRPDGSLYPLIRGRADRAYEFYKKQIESGKKAPVLIPSGGQGSDEVMPEGEAMKNYLLSLGVPESDIIAETKSATTSENIRFSKALAENADDKCFVVATTNYHVYRGCVIARENGLKAHGIGAKTKWYFWPNAALRELVGLFVNQPKLQLAIILAVALLSGLATWLYNIL